MIPFGLFDGGYHRKYASGNPFLFWIITYFSNQDSTLVFVVLWLICILTFYFYNNYFTRKK